MNRPQEHAFAPKVPGGPTCKWCAFAERAHITQSQLDVFTTYYNEGDKKKMPKTKSYTVTRTQTTEVIACNKKEAEHKAKLNFTKWATKGKLKVDINP